MVINHNVSRMLQSIIQSFLKKRKRINEKKQLDKALLKVSKAHISDHGENSSIFQLLCETPQGQRFQHSNKRKNNKSDTPKNFLGVMVLPCLIDPSPHPPEPITERGGADFNPRPGTDASGTHHFCTPPAPPMLETL